MPEAHAGPAPPRMLPSKRVAFLWLSITIALWAGNVVWQLSAARADARAGEEALRSVADVSNATDVDLDELSAALSTGRLDLRSAEERLESPVLVPLRPIPIVGRQLSSARSLVAVSEDIASELHLIVERAREVRADPNQVDRTVFLSDVAAGLDRLDDLILTAELGPDTDLLPALADGRYELETRMLDLQRQAETYRIIAAGMAEFLDGSRYLLVGANNAEMRTGAGTFLSVGGFDTLDGEFDLPGLTPAWQLAPISGASILDPDVARMWGFTSAASDFRSIGYSARFDEHLGPQSLELWEAATGEELDGVIMVDPYVLDALLGVIGEVEIEGRTFRQGDALTYLLSEQYAVFDGADVAARQDVLSVLATAVVDKLATTAWDPIDLLRQLEPVADGRHIMAYSNDSRQQAAWEAMGIDGSLTGSETGVFLLNHGASKLDAVVKLSVEADLQPTVGSTVVTYEITVTNDAGPELPAYVLGPWESLDLPEPGTYLGRIAVYVPAEATDARFLAGLPADAAGPDGAVQLRSSTLLEIRPGAARRYLFQYTLPDTVGQVDILPSARFPAVDWVWDDEAFTDEVPRTVATRS